MRAPSLGVACKCSWDNTETTNYSDNLSKRRQFNVTHCRRYFPWCRIMALTSRREWACNKINREWMSNREWIGDVYGRPVFYAGVTQLMWIDRIFRREWTSVFRTDRARLSCRSASVNCRTVVTSNRGARQQTRPVHEPWPLFCLSATVVSTKQTHSRHTV